MLTPTLTSISMASRPLQPRVHRDPRAAASAHPAPCPGLSVGVRPRQARIPPTPTPIPSRGIQPGCRPAEDARCFAQPKDNARSGRASQRYRAAHPRFPGSSRTFSIHPSFVAAWAGRALPSLPPSPLPWGCPAERGRGLGTPAGCDPGRLPPCHSLRGRAEPSRAPGGGSGEPGGGIWAAAGAAGAEEDAGPAPPLPPSLPAHGRARTNKGAGPGPPQAEILLVAGPRRLPKSGGRVERQRGDSSWLPERFCPKTRNSRKLTFCSLEPPPPSPRHWKGALGRRSILGIPEFSDFD